MIDSILFTSNGFRLWEYSYFDWAPHDLSFSYWGKEEARTPIHVYVRSHEHLLFLFVIVYLANGVLRYPQDTQTFDQDTTE